MREQEHIQLPNAEQFRCWVKEVLAILGIRAHRLGEISGVGKNSARKFVTGEQYDLRLNTARMLVSGARQIAKDDGKALPPLPYDDGLNIGPEE